MGGCQDGGRWLFVKTSKTLHNIFMTHLPPPWAGREARGSEENRGVVRACQAIENQVLNTKFEYEYEYEMEVEVEVLVQRTVVLQHVLVDLGPFSPDLIMIVMIRSLFSTKGGHICWRNKV